MEHTKDQAQRDERHEDSHNDDATNTNTCSSTPPPSKTSDAAPRQNISLRTRIKHFTFAWFLSTMSTGGLALALGLTPHQFRGLYTIGLVLFFFNVALFVLLCCCMAARIALHPSHVLKVLCHPGETYFVGSWWLSVSVVIAGVQVFGVTRGPGWAWLVRAVYALYWTYAALSLVNAIAQYTVLITASTTRPVAFTPAMFLPGYSAMLTGTLGSLIAPTQPPARAVLVVVSGTAYQGFGWLVSLLCVGYFVRLLLDKGLPPQAVRPALFIPVGSVAYTIVALIGLADGIPDHGYFSRHPAAKEICQVVALLVGVFMWLFAFWLFALAVVGNILAAHKMPFSLSWWALVFPNVGFMLATSMIGKELESAGVLWVASALTIGLVAIWGVSLVACVRAVVRGDIVGPGKDEDKDL
jgi:C4-dicarboxylate transporter/malic acid transport protein